MLTTDELRQIVETDHVQCGDAAAMARELLANREAQPVGFYTTVSGRKGVVWHNGAPEDDTAIYTAPPAPAVPAPAVPPEKKLPELMMASYHEAIGWNACRAAMLAQPVSQGNKLPPHAYRELVNTLRDTAVKYCGTDQLRERLNTALSQFIKPDHPHTRTAAPEGGN